MRLLNIIQCTNLGGMEKSNLLLLKSLMQRGHEVELISLAPLGPQVPLLEAAGIPTTSMDYSGFLGWRSLKAMRRAFRERRADAILMTGHNLAATLCLVGIPAKRKVQSIHYHHFEDDRDHLKWRIIYRVANAAFDRFTFCSQYIFNEATSIAPYLRRKAKVSPNPFEVSPQVTADQRRAARVAFGIDPSTPVVGNAGWLIRRKRFDVFLRTAVEILKRCPKTEFLVAGDGPERPSIEALAAELGIAAKVHFLGWQADLTQFYQALDLVVFNSDFDALARAPIEAAAAGVPVVASLLEGGLSEVFHSPDEITLLDRHDVEALAGAAVDLLTDADRRGRVASAAQRRVVEYGSVVARADTIERMLEGID
jgi:glycosyltransferase involved in cell wall biosynthesis